MSVITAEDVAKYLGIPYLASDERLEKATKGAVAWTVKRRSLTEASDLWYDDDVILGATMFAGLLYQQRATPQGLAGSDELGNYSEDVGLLMVQIYRLVGSDPVFA